MSGELWCDIRADGYTVERTTLGPSMVWTVCRQSVLGANYPEAWLPTIIPEMAERLNEYAEAEGMTVDWPSVVWSVERSDDLVTGDQPRAWVEL